MDNRIAAWASVAEIFASLAVVVSLVFLVAEVDRNTEATLGETSQHLLELLHGADDWLTDPAFAEIAVRAEDPDAAFTAVELTQYAAFVYQKLNVCELAFDRRQANLVSDDYWTAWEDGCTALLEAPLARQVWQDRRTWFGPGFRAWYDSRAASYE